MLTKLEESSLKLRDFNPIFSCSVGQASADDTNVRSRLVRLLQLPLTIDYRAAPKLKASQAKP